MFDLQPQDLLVPREATPGHGLSAMKSPMKLLNSQWIVWPFDFMFIALKHGFDFTNQLNQGLQASSGIGSWNLLKLGRNLDSRRMSETQKMPSDKCYIS